MSAQWREEEHPRDDEGKFTYKNDRSSHYSEGLSEYDKRMAEIERQASILFPSMKDVGKNERYNYFDNNDLNYNNEQLSREDILFPSMINLNKNKILLASSNINDNNSKEIDLSSDWIMPVDGGYISSPYGNRKSPGPGASSFHSGVDIAVPVGTPVKAIADGYVRIASGGIKGYGNAVYIDHGVINGKRVESEYGHVSQFCVEPGQKVKKGQVIALSGGKKGAPGFRGVTRSSSSFNH